jgi:hypothetical protein
MELTVKKYVQLKFNGTEFWKKNEGIPSFDGFARKCEGKNSFLSELSATSV